MIFLTQITENSQNIQQQVNGYCPKSYENQQFIPSKLGGYGPKRVAKSASFPKVGGYSPKSDTAADKNLLKIHLLYGFWPNI